MYQNRRAGISPLIWIIIGIFLLGEAVLILRGGSLLTRSQSHKRVIDPTKPMVALTFDDGPGAASERILDCLAQHSALATFFEVGQNVDTYPELSRRAYEMGCETGSHTYAHIDLYASGEDKLLRDEASCEQAFQNATGTVPTLVRPPEGKLGSTAKALYNTAFIGWSVDTEDWRYRDASHVIGVVQSFGDLNGQVILMHSLYESTAEATEVLVPWLQAQGYQLVTVSELLQYHYGATPEAHLFYSVDYFYYGKDPY